jgi:hypothetical protein
MDEPYRLSMSPPSVPDHQRLRLEAGLTPCTVEQAEPAVPGSWAACHVTELQSGETVTFVSLMADPPGRRLYARHGFTEDREKSVGMAMWTDR